MCGRAYGPRFLFMWPNARISVMGGEQAASVLATVKRENIEAEGGKWSEIEEEEFKQPIREQYEARGQSLLRHGAAVGRRHHRARRHPPRPRARASRRRSTRRSRRPGSACFGCSCQGSVIRNRFSAILILIPARTTSVARRSAPSRRQKRSRRRSAGAARRRYRRLRRRASSRRTTARRFRSFCCPARRYRQ